MFFEYLDIIQNFIKETSWFELAFKWLVWYWAFFWFALVIWVARDAINRSNSIIFHIFSIILNIFLPIFGLMIYLLVRPPRTLLDKYYEDLEFQALSWSDSKDYCPKCQAIVEKDYKFCWSCWHSLVDKCGGCSKEFLTKYKACPFCWEKKWKKKKVKEKEEK